MPQRHAGIVVALLAAVFAGGLVADSARRSRPHAARAVKASNATKLAWAPLEARSTTGTVRVEGLLCDGAPSRPAPGSG